MVGVVRLPKVPMSNGVRSVSPMTMRITPGAARSSSATAAVSDVRAFWPTSLAQVYPELARLEEAGLVKRRDDPHGGRARSAYEITKEGEQALLAWQVEEALRRIGTSHRQVIVESYFRGRPYDTVDAHVHYLQEVLTRCQFDSLTYLSSTRRTPTRASSRSFAAIPARHARAPSSGVSLAVSRSRPSRPRNLRWDV